MVDTPRSLQPFQPAPQVKVTEGKPHAGTERAASQQPTAKADTKSLVGRNIYEANGKEVTAGPKDKAANGEGASNGAAGSVDLKDLEEKEKHPPRLIKCQNCAVDCSRVYCEEIVGPDQTGPFKASGGLKRVFCPRCIQEGLYDQSLKSENFQIIRQPDASTGQDLEDNWTDEEVLALLEGLEAFDEDWNSVANHVKTKTREQCVMKFLQLEIEDKYLESDLPESDKAEPSVKFLRELEYLSEGRLPIYHGDSPILSVISFLAGLAPPSITEAAVAAKRTIPQMLAEQQSRMKKMGTLPSSEKEKGKEKEKDKTPAEAEVKNEDAMEVDIAQESSVVAAKDTSTAQSNDTSNPLAVLPFALSAARSSALASHEERHITRLVSGAVNLQLQKLQLKMAHFNDFEKLLSAERRDLQRRRQQLFMDRLNFQRRVRALEDATKKISANLGGQGLPGAMNPEDAVAALTEAIRTFGVGKGEEGAGVKRDSVDGSVQPIAEGGDGFGKVEV